MYKTRYVLLHHDQVVMKADSYGEIALEYFKVEVFRRKDGDLGIKVLGRKVPTGFVSVENSPERGFTPAEAQSDYIACNFNPGSFNRRWPDYAIYELCE